MVLHCQQLNCFTIKDHYIKTRKWLFTQKPSSFISMIAIWAKFVFLLLSSQLKFMFLCFRVFATEEAIDAFGFPHNKVYNPVTLYRRMCIHWHVRVMFTSKNWIWLSYFSSSIFRKLFIYLSLSLNQKCFEGRVYVLFIFYLGLPWWLRP